MVEHRPNHSLTRGRIAVVILLFSFGRPGNAFFCFADNNIRSKWTKACRLPLPSTTSRDSAQRIMACGTIIGDDPGLLEEDAWNALERLEELDVRLGVGVGATKERTKLRAIIERWEETEAAKSAQRKNIVEDDDEDDDDDIEDASFFDNAKFVPKHMADERVAIFGGDPARRRQSVEKKLAPYQSLDQFGTPRDVGPSDASNLIKKISSGKYDVVYIWSRFNCHSSRNAIRNACMERGTRIEEVESLSYIR